MGDDGDTRGAVYGAGRSWFGRRVAGWSVLAAVAVALMGFAAPRDAPATQVRLTTASTSTEFLTPEERALLALMDPKDRARFLLQERLAERAGTAAMLSDLEALRHETALSVIRNIR